MKVKWSLNISYKIVRINIQGMGDLFDQSINAKVELLTKRFNLSAGITFRDSITMFSFAFSMIFLAAIILEIFNKTHI